MQLEQVSGALARTQGQLTTAHAAFDKAMAVKKAFMLEKERKTREALNAIRDYRRAQWQKKVADSMEQFEVAGISATHDEMVRKIEERPPSTKRAWRWRWATWTSRRSRSKKRPRSLRANELVKQFKAEMGLIAAAACRRRAAENHWGNGNTEDGVNALPLRGADRNTTWPSKLNEGGWVLIFILGVGLVGYSLNKYGVLNVSKYAQIGRLGQLGRQGGHHQAAAT